MTLIWLLVMFIEILVWVKTLLEKYPEKKVFLFGIDKGANTKEAVDWHCWINKKRSHSCSWQLMNLCCKKKLRREVQHYIMRNDLFPSLIDLFADEDLKENLCGCMSRSLPFACVKTHGKIIIYYSDHHVLINILENLIIIVKV